MFLLWSNYLLCSGLAHSLCKPLKIMFSHSKLAAFLSKSLSCGTYQDISIHESDVYLACQTVPGCKDPIVDSLTCCRHPQPTKRLWNTAGWLQAHERKQRSLFSKEGGPPIIMGPLGLRTAVRAVAGCQYPHSPALRKRRATSFTEEHAQIDLKDRAPAHLMQLTS